MFLSKNHIHQTSMDDCGVACIAMILNNYGYKVNYHHLYNKLKIGSKGMTLYEMISFFKDINIQPKIYYLKNKLLSYNSNIERHLFPIIALLHGESSNHYIVIYSIENGKIKYSDPTKNCIMSSDSIDIINNIILIVTLDFSNFQDLDRRLLKKNKNFVFHCLYKQKKSLLKIMFFSIVLSLLSFALSMRLGLVIDYIIPLEQNGYIFLIILCMMFLSILIFQGLFSYLKDLISFNSIKNIEKELNNLIVRKVLSDDNKIIKSLKTGEIISRINDCTSMTMVLSNFITIIVPNILISIFVITYLFSSNVMLTSIAIVFSLINFVVLKLSYSKIYLKSYDSAEAYSKYNGVVIEKINSIEDIHATHSIQFHINIIKERLNKYIEESLGKEIYVLSIKVLQSFIFAVSSLIVLYMGSKFCIDNKISIGELVIFINLYGILSNFSITFVNFQMNLESFIISYDRIQQMLDFSILETTNLCGKNFINNKKYKVNSIELINFTIKHNEQILLNNVNIEFISKNIIIKGKSGTGKSSLVKSIAGLKDDYEGIIKINGNLYLSNFSPNIVYISNEINLFNGTIYDNLCLGKKIINNRLIKLCDDFCVLDLIKSLPNGFEYTINSRIANISTGEKQRLALVRALLLDPDILILDEALSNIDEVNKSIILNNLNKYDCMIIYVAHEHLQIQNSKIYNIKDNSIYIE